MVKFTPDMESALKLVLMSNLRPFGEPFQNMSNEVFLQNTMALLVRFKTKAQEAYDKKKKELLALGGKVESLNIQEISQISFNEEFAKLTPTEKTYFMSVSEAVGKVGNEYTAQVIMANNTPQTLMEFVSASNEPQTTPSTTSVTSPQSASATPFFESDAFKYGALAVGGIGVLLVAVKLMQKSSPSLRDKKIHAQAKARTPKKRS